MATGNYEDWERDELGEYFRKLNFIFMKVCWLFLARSEQREARRLSLALARSREDSDGSGATHDFLTREAPPCGGTEPARSEPQASEAQAGDLLGVRQPPSQRNIALSSLVR